MESFTRESLRRLMVHNLNPCASVFLPTHRAGIESKQDPIRYKNLLNQAAEQLKNLGGDKSMLEPARELLDPSHEEFWIHQSDGLAVFAAPDMFAHYRVPLALDELVVVNNRFHVKPLLPLLQNDGRFYLLAVSQKNVRILEGTRHTVRELHPEGLSKNLQEALNIDEYVTALQYHSHSTGSVSGEHAPREAIFHGHGQSVKDGKKTDLLLYFQRLNDALADFFGADRTPLVFAGVDYLFPIFRQACRYRALVETPVAGNPDELSIQQLHQKSWLVVEPIFHAGQQAALERYGAQSAKKLASSDLLQVVAAARSGRIDTILLAKGVRQWGSLDLETGEIRLFDKPEAGADDLLDFAAVHTLLHGGTVFVVDLTTMPEGKPAAAIFRFALG